MKWPAFLQTRPLRVATIFLLAQAAVLYTVSRAEDTPEVPALANFPSRLRLWDVDFDGSIEAEAKAIAKADETGEPIEPPKQGFIRNTIRQIKK